jgi:hypothetical protein
LVLTGARDTGEVYRLEDKEPKPMRVPEKAREKLLLARRKPHPRSNFALRIKIESLINT